MAKSCRRVAVCAAAFVVATADAAPALQLQLNPNGEYNILVGGESWFTSADLQFLAGGQVYSRQSGSLSAYGSPVTNNETDNLGPYVSTLYSWKASDSQGSILDTRFKVYQNVAAIAFETAITYPSPSQANGQLTVMSTFPTLAAGPDLPSRLGVLYQDPASGNCGWTVSASQSFPSSSGGLLIMSPAISADAPPTSRISVGFAAITQQTVVRQAIVPVTSGSSAAQFALTAGPGAEYNFPAGFTSATILVASTGDDTSTINGILAGYSSAKSDSASVVGQVTATQKLPTAVTRSDLGLPPGGPNHALYLLGDSMLSFHQKQRPAMNFDRIHSTLGYSTIGFYFYNPCDCGRWPNNTCPPAELDPRPHRIPNCNTYGDTLLAVNQGLIEQGITIGHVMLDSWWYGEGIFNGVWEWEDDPVLLQKANSFDPATGVRAVAQAFGPNVDFWAHNGEWVKSSPYIQNASYDFAPQSTMPQGDALWNHLFGSNTAAWNLKTIKQDHVGTQISDSKNLTDPAQVASWLGGMGDAATTYNVSIQYCCSPPVVLHNGVNVPAALGARSSPDYVQNAPGRGNINYPAYQWANGVESAFHFGGVGLMPDKDGFFSNSTQTQHGGDGLKSDLWPSFYNWTEQNPVKHAVMALLCGGPVHVSDAVGSTNVTLVKALMRADGVLLRPSRPHSGLDVEMRSMMFGGWISGNDNVRGSASPSKAAGSAVAKPGLESDAHFPNGGIGEVYSTVSLISASSPSANAATMPSSGMRSLASSVPTSPCMRYTIITAAEVDPNRPLNLTAADLALDAVALSSSACVANGGAWAAYDWDLDTFNPSTASAGAVRPVFGAGATGISAVIPILGNDGGYAATAQMTVVAPVLGGWLVLGEVGKALPISPQRIDAIVPAASGDGVDVSMVGAPQETVSFWTCPIDSASGACSQALQSYGCQLSSAGVATLTLPAGTCA